MREVHFTFNISDKENNFGGISEICIVPLNLGKVDYVRNKIHVINFL